MTRHLFPVLFLFCFFISSCDSQKESNVLNIAITNFPDSFNPIISSGNQSLEVNRLVYEFVQKIDTTGIIQPFLNDNLRQEIINDSLSAAYSELSESARWPNGQPMSPHDIALSIKLRKTPLINTGSPFDLYPITAGMFQQDSENSIQLLVKGNPQYAKVIAGDYLVIPEYIFDSLHIWRKYDLAYLSNLTDSTAPDELLSYATAFNKLPPYDSVFFEGSGPYEIESVIPDQSISLALRDDWWKEIPAQIDLPGKINFVVIPDATAARFALQNGQIDLMTLVPATEFVQLEKFNESEKSLNLYRQAGFRLVFLGFNTRLNKFSDSRTRQALAHLLDIPSIIDAVKLGYADQTAGPVHPVLDDLYNDTLHVYEQNIEATRKLLIDAGWAFSGEEWVNRQGEKLEFRLQYNGTNKDYEKIALIVKEEAARAGINVEIVQEEGSQLNRKLRSHQFEATIWSFIGSPTAFDFTPLFHTRAARPGNLNFTGFGNARSDQAVEKALLSRTRGEMGSRLKELQQELHKECPMIFLYYEQSLIAASKKFKRLNITYYKPGYDPVGVF